MVSVAEFDSCLFHRWLASPESKLHSFPLIAPALFTIGFIGCLINSSFLPIARLRSGLLLEFLALRALSALNIIPHPFTALTSLAGKFEPCMSSFPWPYRVFFHSNLTLVGVNTPHYYAIPRDWHLCSDPNYFRETETRDVDVVWKLNQC